MKVFVIINKDEIKVNIDVNAKIWLMKVDVVMDLFEILVIVNVTEKSCDVGEYLDYKGI